MKVKLHDGLRPYRHIHLQLYIEQVGCTTMQILCHVDHVITIIENTVIDMSRDILLR